jgi:PST family polysaccharide transporter
MAAQASKIVIQLLAVITLARLLTPYDYGLVAMVTALIGVADTFRDFGLSSAAIQAPQLSRGQQHNLFWLNTGLGALLTGIAMAASPLIAGFYGRPELVPITLALAASFLVNGMATQYRADLYRRMLFRRLALADTLGPLLGLATAIVAAVQGAGFWALVAQQLVALTITLLVMVAGARWLPGGWKRTEPVRPFLSFGWRLAGSQLVTYLGNNIDTIMLGLRVGATQLGIYNRSYQLISAPMSQVRGPLSTVAIPVLSRVQDDDARFQRYVAQGQMVIGYTVVAGLAVVAGSTGPLVDLLLGPQWVEATDILRLLAVAAALQMLSFVGYWVYVSKGLVGHLLHYSFLSTGIRVGFVVTGSFYGVMGVAWAMALSPLVAWPLSFWWLSRRAQIPIRALWLGGLRIVVFAALIGVAAGVVEALTPTLPALVRLLLIVAAAAATYAMLCLVPRFRRDLAGVVGMVRQNLRRPEGGTAS